MGEPPFVVAVPSDRFFVDDHCGNCLELMPEDVEGLFCSAWCAEIAATVRYQRRVYCDGRIREPDVQRAVQIRNAFLLAGGYRALGRTLSTATRVAVKNRDDGRCRSCGKPGTEIDHIAGSSPQLDNLQLLCSDCHHDKTSENLVPASRKQRAQLRALFLSRVMPETPRLLADDEVAWESLWRGLRAARKKRFLDAMVDAGVDVFNFKGRAQIIAARDRANS